MNIQEHIGKITWSVADKGLFVIYGFVTIIQFAASSPEEIGLFYLLINIYTWIFIISDGFALQSLIQFGMNKERQKRVNAITLLLHIGIVMAASMIVFALQGPVSSLFNEEKFGLVAMLLPLFTLLAIPRVYCVKLVLREREFKKLFFINLSFFGTLTAMTLFFVFTLESLKFRDLIILYSIGLFVSSAVAILINLKKLKFNLEGDIKISHMLRFSLPYGLYASLHSMPKLLDVIVVQIFFSTGAVGIYQSAKNLFRFFDEAVNGSYGLVYPPAVNLLEKGDYEGLNGLMTKSASFMFWFFAIIVLTIWLGGSELFITTFLPEKYHAAIDMFNLMSLAAFAMPFIVLTLVITATGKPHIVLLYVATATALAFGVYFLVGIYGGKQLMPLGIVVYNVTLGSLSFYYANRKLNFRFVQLFRAFSDTKHFIQKYISKKRPDK